MERTKKITISISLVVVTVLLIAFTGPVLQSEKKEIIADILLAPLKISDLAKDSDHIILGTVSGISAGPVEVDQVHTLTKIFTDVTLDVDQDLAGTYKSSQITFRTLGGTNGNAVVYSDDEAKFIKGERVLVFVTHVGKDTVWGDSYVIYGMKLGKYSIVNGKAAGPEYPDGINEAQLIDIVKQARTTSAN